jgi:hypothetical protein
MDASNLFPYVIQLNVRVTINDNICSAVRRNAVIKRIPTSDPEIRQLLGVNGRGLAQFARNPEKLEFLSLGKTVVKPSAFGGEMQYIFPPRILNFKLDAIPNLT